jgi:hypothetical protein
MLMMVGTASFRISFSTGSVVMRRYFDSGDCREKAFDFKESCIPFMFGICSGS